MNPRGRACKVSSWRDYKNSVDVQLVVLACLTFPPYAIGLFAGDRAWRNRE
jgi:hypothetical protein